MRPVTIDPLLPSTTHAAPLPGVRRSEYVCRRSAFTIVREPLTNAGGFAFLRRRWRASIRRSGSPSVAFSDFNSSPLVAWRHCLFSRIRWPPPQHLFGRCSVFSNRVFFCVVPGVSEGPVAIWCYFKLRLNFSFFLPPRVQ